MKRKVLVMLSLLLTLTFVLTSCQSGKSTEANENANVDVQGDVMIYTSMYEDIIDQIKPELQKQFPNVNVEFFQGGTGSIQSKVAAELEGGKLDCDMLMVAEPSYSMELKEKGLLHPVVVSNAENINNALDKDPEGYWYPVRISNMVLAYNPEKVDEANIAKTFNDFAHNENLQGKISMSNPLTSGTALASISGLRDLYSFDYFEALGKQKVAVESGSVALGKLETGECDEIMVLEESVLKKRQEENSELTVIYPEDGTIVIPSTICTIKPDMSKNNNPEACEAITEWFLSPEGQSVIVDGWMHSVLQDVPKVPYDAKPTEELLKNAMKVDWERTYKDREMLRTEFEKDVSVPKK